MAFCDNKWTITFNIKTDNKRDFCDIMQLIFFSTECGIKEQLVVT